MPSPLPCQSARQQGGQPLWWAHPSDLSHRRLRKPEPKILEQLRSRGNNLYVVTEVLQTQEKVQFTQTRKKDGSGQFALNMCLQVCGYLGSLQAPHGHMAVTGVWEGRGQQPRQQQGWALLRLLGKQLTRPVASLSPYLALIHTPQPYARAQS
jgi:hypothetical protein